MKKFLILIAAAAMAACVQNAPKAQTEDTTATEAVADKSPTTIIVDGESMSMNIVDNLDSLTDSRTYTIDAMIGQTLYLSLAAPDEPANVRVNQIISPSGAADGPFGRDVQYEITEDGTWTIIVAESLMNGEEYKGEFTLTATLK
ncbi:MAG: hypothetical protein LBU95_05195 [Rikenellaceae bacterium]|jgi:hypothetical protein|nr:hypothetical protein [Rikenellaceae bacterium]